MTPQPELAAGGMSDDAAGEPAPLTAASGSYVLNLCSSTTPMALAHTELPELRRFNFFVSRRFEEGRERFRLHMGFFATLAEAEEWLSVVREIYPGAWAGEAPGRKLRARAAAAAADQARHAAGPQSHGATGARQAVRSAQAVPPPSVRVPVVHAAPPAAQRIPPRTVSVAAPAARQAPQARSIPRVATAPARSFRPAPPAAPGAAAPSGRPVTARPAAGRAARPFAATRPAPVARPQSSASAAARAGATGRAPMRKAAFSNSNVREVLAALGETSATGETRQMHAPVPPRTAVAHDSLSETQALRVLEDRRPDGAEEPAADVPARSIPLLKPDDTGTRRALKEAVATNAPVWFAVQLQWSVQPVELAKVPPLAIFSAYTLYTVEGSRDGRRWYGLRLGFFSHAISAKQVAYYVRSEFGSVAVVPVSPEERTRASEADRLATVASPGAARRDVEEFKLFDVDKEPPPLAQAHPAKSAPKPASPAREAARRPRPARVGARERRGGPSLEETLEILGATELTIEDERRDVLSDTGVRHLKIQEHKDTPFSRLLERLSDRIRKP